MSRDEYSVQLNLTNSYQRGFYRETWPNIFSKLRRVGQEAEEGVNDLLSRVVSGGLDQWPEPHEAWGELDNAREMLDFKGIINMILLNDMKLDLPEINFNSNSLMT